MPRPDTINLTVRLPRELHERMRAAADTPGQRTSIATWVRNAIEQRLARDKEGK